MKVIIDMEEIREAVACYLNSKGVDTKNHSLKVDVIAGRGELGARIEMEMTPKEDEKLSVPTKPFQTSSEDETQA